MGLLDILNAIKLMRGPEAPDTRPAIGVKSEDTEPPVPFAGPTPAAPAAPWATPVPGPAAPDATAAPLAPMRAVPAAPQAPPPFNLIEQLRTIRRRRRGVEVPRDGVPQRM